MVSRRPKFPCKTSFIMFTVWMILPVMASFVSFAALLLKPPYVATVPAVPTLFALMRSISSLLGAFGSPSAF